MSKLRALIIEDDPKLGEIYLTAVRQAGFEADLDPTGKNFSAKLTAPAPSLILLDIHLPYASGVEVFEMIRAHAEWKTAVIIVATADLFLAKTLKGKADYVLVKPLSVSKLLNIIAERWKPETDTNLDTN